MPQLKDSSYFEGGGGECRGWLRRWSSSLAAVQHDQIFFPRMTRHRPRWRPRPSFVFYKRNCSGAVDLSISSNAFPGRSFPHFPVITGNRSTYNIYLFFYWSRMREFAAQLRDRQKLIIRPRWFLTHNVTQLWSACNKREKGKKRIGFMIFSAVFPAGHGEMIFRSDSTR